MPAPMVGAAVSSPARSALVWPPARCGATRWVPLAGAELGLPAAEPAVAAVCSLR
jgi:hypothetical protein